MSHTFNLNDYTDGGYRMVCIGHDEIDEFSRVLDESGRTWRSGHKYTERKDPWEIEIEELEYPVGCVFYFNENTRGYDVSYVDDRTLFWSDFKQNDDSNISYDDLFDE